MLPPEQFFYLVFLPKHFPFSFLLFPPNLPTGRQASLTRSTEQGAVLCQGVSHARLLPVHSSWVWPSGNRMKEKESVFEKLSKQTLFHQQTFVSSRNFQARIFQSSLEDWGGTVFSERKRARASKQSSRHAGANGWYFGRLLAGKFPFLIKGSSSL
mgnify:CR=1 FL=1